MNLHELRESYQAQPFTEADCQTDPIKQFISWMEAAINSELPEPNAMILATADAQRQPHARVVLLKEVMADGFVFYTNYESHKANEIAQNAAVALTFNWLELARQIRIEGRAQKVPEAQSKAYFQSRPKSSQIGAWASPQSRKIENREILEDRVLALQEQYADADSLPLPPNWGGYIVWPERIEFWQGRPSRLHDRLVYSKIDNGWQINRLAP